LLCGYVLREFCRRSRAARSASSFLSSARSEDAQDALAKIIADTTSGAILADEAATLASIISSFVKTIEVAELESRLAALEKASAPPSGRAYDA
jgi:hypothetical protein